MGYVVIKGVRPYDGRYEFDLDGEFTNKELAWIKHHSGYQPLTLSDGLRAGDAELWCILGAIALHRNGKIDARQVPLIFEQMMEGPYGSTVEPELGEEEEADAALLPQLELEWRYFWARFRDEFGEPGDPPESYWDPRIGHFGIRPAEVGELTPAQLLLCVDYFGRMYGGGDA